MSIELIVRETLERKLADVRVPRTDVAEVRRVGRGRRRAQLLGVVAAVLASAGVVSAMLVWDGEAPQGPTNPAVIPQMDFSAGLRGFYDPTTGQTHLGGQSFELGGVADVGRSAVTTPYGLVFVTANQAVRVLPADGRVRTIAAPPPRPDVFTPTLAYDPVRGTVAWLTKSAGKVNLSVYEFPFGSRLLGSYPVPCSGDGCNSLAVTGLDQGLVFVSGANGSRALDPAFGPIADWSFVTDGRVTDVRNHVILAWNATEPLPVPFSEAGWRIAPASSETSQLTVEGDHEISASSMLSPTVAGGTPIPLALPPGEGQVVATMDTDGSVLVARTEGDVDVFYDCVPGGACDELGRVGSGKGDPVFFGHHA